MIFTSISPNTQEDDFHKVRKILFSPSQYIEGVFPRKVKKWFREMFHVKYVSVYESARTGLYFLLKELGTRKADEVILQAFTCVAVVNPIKWVGAKPVFVDINPETFNMDLDDLVNKVSDKTRVIIVQHTFGYPAEVDKIVSFAKGRKIAVIEDCTHTIGTELDGKKLGTFGDGAIFSFGRDKAISASFGGVVITNRKRIGAKLEARETFLHYPPKEWIARQLLYTIIAYLVRKYYTKLGLGKLLHLIFLKLGIITKATSEGEKKQGTMPSHAKSNLPNALASVAFHQLVKIPKMNKVRHQFSCEYLKQLKKVNVSEITVPNWKIQKNIYPIRFPIRVKRREELVEYAKKRDILLGDWYDVPIAPKEVDLVKTGYRWGSCPSAEKVCGEIVNLPLNINLNEEDVLKIITLLKEFYS